MIKDVSIEIIQKCLNFCMHCSSCSSAESTAILPINIIKEVVDGLEQLGAQRICLSGGEPLLHHDVIEIVQYISQKGIAVDIYSCGVIGTSEKPVAISEDFFLKLKTAGLGTVMFNMPASTEQIYNAITQTQGHFPLLTRSIANAVKCDIRTEIHFVPMKPNASDAINVVNTAKQLGVKQLNYLKLVPHGRAKENIDLLLLSDDDISSFQELLLRLKEHGESIRIGLPLSINGTTPPCHAVSEKLYIKFDGTVFGCEAFKYITFEDSRGQQIPPDSIFNTPIAKIYQDSQFLMQSKVLVNNYSKCSVGCENCPVQKYIKSQEEFK